jgi:hypothetical protein
LVEPSRTALGSGPRAIGGRHDAAFTPFSSEDSGKSIHVYEHAKERHLAARVEEALELE